VEKWYESVVATPIADFVTRVIYDPTEEHVRSIQTAFLQNILPTTFSEGKLADATGFLEIHNLIFSAVDSALQAETRYGMMGILWIIFQLLLFLLLLFGIVHLGLMLVFQILTVDRRIFGQRYAGSLLLHLQHGIASLWGSCLNFLADRRRSTLEADEQPAERRSREDG